MGETMPEPQADELAGRALDAEVARRVFGHTVREDAPHGFDYRATSGPNNYEHWARVPPYSTQIGAAWAVVEQFRFFELTTPNRKGDPLWRCVVDAPTGFAHGFGETAPEAICRAALAALDAAAAEAPTRGDVGEE